MQLSQKQKIFSKFFAGFLKSGLNFEQFGKKITLTAFVFPKLQILEPWLDKYLKSAVSEDPLTSNMINMRKHCSNLHYSTFIIFIGHWQGNCNRKNLS